MGDHSRPVQLLVPSTFLCCDCVTPASPSPHGLAPRVSVSLLISQRHQFETVPGGPVVGTLHFHCRGFCVQSQVGELRSYMLHSAAKKIFFNGEKKKGFWDFPGGWIPDWGAEILHVKKKKTSVIGLGLIRLKYDHALTEDICRPCLQTRSRSQVSDIRLQMRVSDCWSTVVSSSVGHYPVDCPARLLRPWDSPGKSTRVGAQPSSRESS